MLGGGALAAALAAGSPARGEPRLTPMIGAEVGASHERLAVKLPGYTKQEDRWLLQGSLALGLSVALPEPKELPLRLDSTVTYGKVIHTGHHRISLREDALTSVALGGRFFFLGGVGLGLVLDATQLPRSAGELAVPLGLRYRAVELLYRPALVVPLGKEESPVFGGQREQSARPGLAPLAVLLRVRL